MEKRQAMGHAADANRTDLMTITRYVLNEQSKHPESRGDFTILLNHIVLGCVFVCSAVNKIGAAKKLYFDSQGHEFKWYGCWQILKDTAKWFQHTQLVEQRKQKLIQKKREKRVLEVEGIQDLTESISSYTSSMYTPITPLTAADDHDTPDGGERSDSPDTFSVGTSELPRPPGRKATKNARRMKTANNSEVINLFVTEFSKLQNVEKEIADNQNMMALRREQMRIEAKREEEQKKFEAKRDEEKRKFEKEIMMTDPTTMATEEGKNWVIAHQKAIMARINAQGVD